MEAAEFPCLDFLMEFLLYLENPVSSLVVDPVAVGAAVLEAAEVKCLDVLLEFPLEIAYDVCLVLNFLKLFSNSRLGHAALNC